MSWGGAEDRGSDGPRHRASSRLWKGALQRAPNESKLIEKE